MNWKTPWKAEFGEHSGYDSPLHEKLARDHKRISGRWISNNSLRRNHADYLLFSRKGNLR